MNARDSLARTYSHGIGLAVLTPLLELCSIGREELLEQALQQRPSLGELSRRVDMSHARSAQDEIRELCRAFTTGASDEIRERRIRLAQRLAGCEGVEHASLALLSQRMRMPADTIQRDTERVFKLIAQAASLGLLPATPRIDALMAPAFDAENELQVLAVRFGTQVLLKPSGSRTSVSRH